jgi:competence protein ComEC
VISDNHIHDIGNVFSNAVGVWIGQSNGNLVSHNEIDNTYYSGISVGWTWGWGRTAARDNVIEFNQGGRTVPRKPRFPSAAFVVYHAAMRVRLASFFVLLFLLVGPSRSPAAQGPEFYIVDVGHGNAVFVQSGTGQTMLIDTGARRAANRVLAFLKQAGVKQIDYLLVSHFEDDHMGAAAALAAEFPILNFVDHGESIVYGKSDEWWKQRRTPWARPGIGKAYDESYEAYRQVREKGKHIIVRPGDKIPIEGMDVLVVSSGGKVISTPLKGAGAPNAACARADRRSEDDAEDGQSIGVLVTFGKFRFVDLGDLTWNAANALFCPRNLVGTVDAYVITHHAQSLPQSLGDYYYGLSCCSEAEVHGLQPRVAFLSLGALGHKEGTPAAIEVVRNSPGREDVWQTENITAGGEAGHNAPEQFIANLGAKSAQTPFVKLSANSDGSFTVTNSRNQYAKKYGPRK